MTLNLVEQSSATEDELDASSLSIDDDKFIIRTCSGIDCALNKFFRQFRVKSNATRSAPNARPSGQRLTKCY